MAVDKVVPFNDLSRAVHQNRELLDGAINRVLDSGWFVLGPENEALESEIAEFVGSAHAVNVGNGTDALELGLAALGVGQGDTVLTVANAGAYTSTAVLLLGAEPVYVDIDPSTFLMSGATLENALAVVGEKPKVVVVTHLYGALAPMEEILNVARRHGILVLEDCAQSLGARNGARQAGNFGDIATTSFYPTKNLGALGDGGAIFTNNDELARSVRQMRQYGWTSKYHIEHRHGKNSRLDEIQAAILRSKLLQLDAQNERRREIHSQYESASHDGVRMLNTSHETFIGHLAVVVADNRDSVRKSVESAGVKTDIHYPIADYRQNFPGFIPRPMPLDATEWATASIFSVPLFPELTSEEIRIVTSAIESA